LKKWLNGEKMRVFWWAEFAKGRGENSQCWLKGGITVNGTHHGTRGGLVEPFGRPVSGGPVKGGKIMWGGGIE